VSVVFRNVDVDPSTSPDGWPFEAILTVIERGVVSDWRRLARAIVAQPWGPCAQAVDTIIGWGENYGVDALFEEILRQAREAADREARAAYGRRIRDERERRGLSLREFAPLIGTSAQRLSSYERGQVAPTVTILGRIDRLG
jgi:DNA-binding XRE family transcriptional regulator